MLGESPEVVGANFEGGVLAARGRVFVQIDVGWCLLSPWGEGFYYIGMACPVSLRACTNAHI